MLSFFKINSKDNNVDNNTDWEENQDLDKKYLESYDDYFETEADVKKHEIIKFLKGNASIPFKLFDLATWDLKTKTEKYQDTEKRITGSIYIDCIILYGFLQYVKQWHERENRLEDGTIYCTKNYVCAGLHWGFRRYTKAIKFLEKHNFVKRRQFPITDKKTKQHLGSYIRLQIMENS